MWLDFESIEHRSDLESRKGTKYSAWVLTATKRGYKDDPDTPYSKIIFDNIFADVIDRKGNKVEMAVYEFFQACEPGDLVVMSQSREPGNDHWEITSLENKTRNVLPESISVTTDPQSNVAVADGWNAAVNFVNVLVNNGHYKDKTSPEILLDAVVTYRARLDSLDSVALDAPWEEEEAA